MDRNAPSLNSSYTSSGGLDTFRRYGTPKRSRSSLIMGDEDKTIYNSLGSSSSPLGKVGLRVFVQQ